MPYFFKSCLVFLFVVSVPCVAFSQSIKDVYEQAVELYNQGRFKESSEFYQKILLGYPNFAPAYNGLGLSAKALGQDEEAIGYYKKAIESDPRFAQAYSNLGKLFYDAQDFAQALGYLDKALKIDPSLQEAKMHLAWVYVLAKPNPAKAIRYFKELVATNPSPTLYYGLGLSYFSNNQRVEALGVITKLKELKNDDLAGRLEKVMRENRRVDTAIQETEKPVARHLSEDAPKPATGIKVRLRDHLPD